LAGGNSLRRQITSIGAEAGASAVAVAFYDYTHHTGWEYQAERWFHAASTIKVPVLLGVFAAIDQGRLQPYSRVHVRNRFLSAADGSPYRVEASRDSNSEVHAAVGRTMQIRELARHMIVTSSNLATNLLIDLVGLEAIQRTLKELGLHGIELRRGVEDLPAWDKGINNRVTASGLLGALRVLAEDKKFSADARREMMDILHAQEFRSGIPAGLPEAARVAHKTGEISTVAHDAGVVYLPSRDPYVVAILTEWPPEGSGRKNTIAQISRAVFEYVTDGEREHV
jgi:beta-lactamase class A